MFLVFVNENCDDWDDYLFYIMMGYCVILYKSINCSLNFLMMGWEVFFLNDIMMGWFFNILDDKCFVMYIEWLKNIMRNIFDFVNKYVGMVYY